MSMTKNEVFDLALEKWGFDIQSLVFVEEMSELTKEIIKIQRNKFFKRSFDYTRMVEEMADVQVMLDQIKYALDEEERDLFQKEYGRKINQCREWLISGVKPL